MATIAARTTETFGGEDYRALASARGTDHPKSGTLDISTYTPATDFPDGKIPAILPVKYDADTGLYGKCDAVDTAATLAGFVFHDVALAGSEDLIISVLTDATIVADLVPGDHDLTDGRYFTDEAHGGAS